MPKLQIKKLITGIIALLVFILLNQLPPDFKNYFLSITPTPTRALTYSKELFLVKRVIDGDTIELENGDKVRYIGVDSPEIHNPKTPIQCFGREAAEFNKKLVEGKTVHLEKDVSETDKYKRLLRYVYIINTASPAAEIFVNKTMVDEGFAYAATFPPDVKYADLFRTSQQEARQKKVGLWNSCPIKK